MLCHPKVSPCVTLFCVTYGIFMVCRIGIKTTIASRTANGCAGSARRLWLRMAPLCRPRHGGQRRNELCFQGQPSIVQR